MCEQQGILQLWNLDAHDHEGRPLLLWNERICWLIHDTVFIALPGMRRCCKRSLTQNPRTGCHVNFNVKDGTKLVAMSVDGFIRCWDTTMLGKPVWEKDVSSSLGHTSASPCRIESSPSGKLAILTSAKAQATVLRLDGDNVETAAVGAHTDAVTTAAWHPHSRFVATGSADKSILVSRVDTIFDMPLRLWPISALLRTLGAVQAPRLWPFVQSAWKPWEGRLVVHSASSSP